MMRMVGGIALHCIGVVVAQDLVKSVNGVNGCGAFVKFE